MKNHFLGAAVILLVFFFVADAAAQQYGRGRGPGRGDGQCFTNLNLTQQQQDKVTKLRGDHFNEVNKMRDELDRLRIDKRAMMRQTNLNRNDYLNIEKKMSALREEIHLASADFRMNVYELLDADQKEQFSKGYYGNQKRGKAGANFRGGQGRGFNR
jgi:Spy/CpxP family protein refolding chaperone